MSFNEKNITPLEIEALNEENQKGDVEPLTCNEISPNHLDLGVQKIKSEILRYSETVPSKFRPIYQRATNEYPSKAASIKAKCLDCMGYQDGPNRIRGCSAYTCPLWAVRPYRNK